MKPIIPWESLVLALLLICWAARVSPGGAEPVRITPQQVVSNALAHSHRLRLMDKETVAAEARQRQAWAAGLPSLSTDARANFYTGLEDTTLGPNVVIPGIENRYGAGVALSQPLFTGGRIRSSKQSAAYQKEAAEYHQRGAQSDVALQALNAYWSWSKAYYLLESIQAAVLRVEAHARNVRNQRQAGLATDNEMLAAEVQLDRTRLRMEEAKRRVNVAGARLTFLTGQAWHPESSPIKATARVNPGLVPEPMLLDAALTNRSERAALQREVQAARAAVKSARAEFYPQVSAVARYEYARPNLLLIPPRDRWHEDGFAGVAMSWNIFDWGLRRAKVAEAAVRVSQAQTRLDLVEEEILLQVREARINLQDAIDRIAVVQRVERSAQRNLEAATDLWTNGLSRHSDVLDAHAQLTDAQFEIIAAHADLELARASLEHAAGLLTGRAALPGDDMASPSSSPSP